MASLSVEGLSGEASSKRPLENGFVPNCKPRKTSAIREFPPRCGFNAITTNFKHEENDECETDIFETSTVKTDGMGDVAAIDGDKPLVEANRLELGSAGTVDRVEFLETDSVRIINPPETENLVDSKYAEILIVGEPNVIQNFDMDVDCWSHCINTPIDVEVAESVDALSENHMAMATDGVFNVEKSVMGIRLPGVDSPNKVENHMLETSNKHVDSLISSIGVENLVAELDSSEKMTEPKDQTMLKELNEREAPDLISNSDVEGAEPVLGSCISSDELPLLGSSQPPSPSFGSLTKKTNAVPKDNYRPRRVSAKRNFPPFCGTKNQPPTEEKKQMIISGADCQEGVEKVEAQLEERNNQVIGSPGATPVRIPSTTNEEDTTRSVGKEIILYSPDGNDKMMPPHSSSNLDDEAEMVVVHALVAAPHCPWRKGKVILKNSDAGIGEGNIKKQNSSVRKKVKVVAKKCSSKMNVLDEGCIKQRKVPIVDDMYKKSEELSSTDEEDLDCHGDLPKKVTIKNETQDIGVNLLPFVPSNPRLGDARNRVRETLRLFHTICRKLLQKEEANLMPDDDKKFSRIDLLAAKIIKTKGKVVNTDKKVLGQIPGVEVGDEFQYRVELAIVGIHSPYQSGIDCLKLNGVQVASSIVSSGSYSDDLDNADVLIYSGQGGNVVGKAKKPEDQKLEKGNLGLRNCILEGTPVRVVRGWRETKAIDPTDSRPKLVTTYVYDGLYTVKRYWTETGPHGKQVFMFELRRNPGQPELAWKELKNANKSKNRPGICVSDISGGQESNPICAVNTRDEEKPPPFKYTRKMIYPEWYRPVPPEGCNCTGRCGDRRRCPCALRNGGEIPYNRNGAIVEAKPLVFECGPYCKCPPSCYNRVTQRGIKFRLEIFKTESRGWGIRSLNSIPSGSFICEYAGELLEDKEAEQRIGSDEYLFDIGQNFSDYSLKPEELETSGNFLEEAEAGYTIDAGQYGNAGRFVNHSCSPNLYAQNVIYDHDDKRMPHVMLFAAENIPPLQELTYHYNYSIDQVRDSNGNIKIKKCYCGSAECTGRMY